MPTIYAERKSHFFADGHTLIQSLMIWEVTLNKDA